MSKSEQIDQLAIALAAAQGEMRPAMKDADNPYFKSKYADLASVWEACRAPLAKNGLSVSQLTAVIDGVLFLETLLMHKSGQWVSGLYPIRAENEKPQTLGSAITYARRYALSSCVGVSTDDDDGNKASGIGHGVEGKKEKGWDQLNQKQRTTKLEALDGPAPKQVSQLPDGLCLFYEPFSQYLGMKFSNMPIEALDHIGKHTKPMLAKSEGTKKDWYEAIVSSLVEELADRAALDGK